MSDTRSEIEELKSLIEQMPLPERHLVKNLVGTFRQLVRIYGDRGKIALSLVAGEMALQEEDAP